MSQKHFQPSIDLNLCKACGYCAFQCPKKLFHQSGKVNSHGYDYMSVQVDDQCVGCLQCIAICPDFAITITEVS